MHGCLRSHWRIYAAALLHYQQRWRFRHPDAIDFMDTVRAVSGQDMKWFFDQTVYGTGMLNYAVSFTTGEAAREKGYFDHQTANPICTPGSKRQQRHIAADVLFRRLGRDAVPGQRAGEI